MITLKATKELIEKDNKNMPLYLMNFVDDFRYYKNLGMLEDSFSLSNRKLDALLASTAEYLCKENKIHIPRWIEDVPVSDTPYFVSGVENLKAIALAESPLLFRIRKVFVLANFLERF